MGFVFWELPISSSKKEIYATSNPISQIRSVAITPPNENDKPIKISKVSFFSSWEGGAPPGAWVVCWCQEDIHDLLKKGKIKISKGCQTKNINNNLFDISIDHGIRQIANDVAMFKKLGNALNLS